MSLSGMVGDAEPSSWHAERVWATLSELSHAAVRTRNAMDLLMLISERAVELLSVDACGVLVRDPSGVHRAVAASSVSPALLDLLGLHATAGPLVDTLGAEPVDIDVSAAEHRWPEYARRSAAEGFDAVHVFPLFAGDDAFGTLNLFGRGRLRPAERGMAQALADLAALHILRGDVEENAVPIMRRVHGAVQSRATLGQAIGVIAEHLALDPDAALNQLREAARAIGAPLTDVAASVAAQGEILSVVLDIAAEDGQ